MLILLSTVRNHGIPEEIVNDFITEAKEYFSLPLEYKMQVRLRVPEFSRDRDNRQLENKKTPNFKGYSPLLSGNNDPNNAGDLQEGFEFGWEPLQSAAHPTDNTDHGIMAGANVWPDKPVFFRQAALNY